jgi:hypothetical protein
VCLMPKRVNVALSLALSGKTYICKTSDLPSHPARQCTAATGLAESGRISHAYTYLQSAAYPRSRPGSPPVYGPPVPRDNRPCRLDVMGGKRTALSRLDSCSDIRRSASRPRANWRSLIQQVGASVNRALSAIRAHAFGAAWRKIWFRLQSQTRHAYVANLGIFKFEFAAYTFKNPLGHSHLGRVTVTKLSAPFVRYRTNPKSRPQLPKSSCVPISIGETWVLLFCVGTPTRCRVEYAEATVWLSQINAPMLTLMEGGCDVS